MARAYIYKNVIAGKGKGLDIQKAMGLVRDVQDRLKLEALEGAARAERGLKVHQHGPDYDKGEGHSFIEVESANIDHHVILNDSRGLGAAMSIEYGRKAATRWVKDGFGGETLEQFGGSEGLWILHDALKLGRSTAGVEMGADFD